MKALPLFLAFACAWPLAVPGEIIGHWRFENATDVGADSGPASRHLVFADAASTPQSALLQPGSPGGSFPDPVYGTALANARGADFDGNDSARTPGDDPAFTSASFSVEAYIHPTTATTSGTQVIAAHFNSAINQRAWALVLRNGVLGLYLSANGSTSEEFYTTASVAAGSDYYVAATVNLAQTGMGGVSLYVQDLSGGGPNVVQHFSHSTTTLLDSTAPLSIGATANGSSFFNGLIDEVRVSNAKLGGSELLAPPPAEPEDPEDPMLPTAEGFAGIWYYIGTHSTYAHKYSGGMATYPQQHSPIAIYAPAVDKTFFVYGGTNEANTTLLHMISYYDHARKQVARPRILVNKNTTDAHDNPVLSIDGAGHIWVFSNTHGESRRSYLWKSREPYDIRRFDEVTLPTAVFPQSRFNYGNPWYIPGHGFILMHTRYNSGDRDLYWTTSTDGVTWSPRQSLSQMSSGQYQMSNSTGSKAGTAFNVHIGSSDNRTNLYYLETSDFGATWQNAAGETVPTPLTTVANAALVHDYNAEGRTVYLKDMGFDSAGRPILLYLTSIGFQPGPQTPARTVFTAHWNGAEWVIRPVTTTDHNYDTGSLYIEADDRWKVIAPFIDGPQHYGTGGEIGIWTSADQGLTWTLERQITDGSSFNHSYARRPVNARNDFYALWADGDAFAESPSSLYFTDKFGEAVFRLPASMSGELAYPELAWISDPQGDPDHDGASTETEFTAGTDPRDPASVLRLGGPRLSAEGAAQLEFPSVPGKLYDLWFTDDLADSWEILLSDLLGTGEALQIEDPGTADVPERFYKLEVK